MRTDEDLNKLLKDFKGWYKDTFNKEFDATRILPVLANLIEKRLLRLAFERLDHMPGFDLIRFKELIENEINAEPPKKKPKA